MKPFGGCHRKVELPGVALFTRVDAYRDGEVIDYYQWMLFIEPTDALHGYAAGGWHIYQRGFTDTREAAEEESGAALIVLLAQWMEKLVDPIAAKIAGLIASLAIAEARVERLEGALDGLLRSLFSEPWEQLSRADVTQEEWEAIAALKGDS